MTHPTGGPPAPGGSPAPAAVVNTARGDAHLPGRTGGWNLVAFRGWAIAAGLSFVLLAAACTEAQHPPPLVLSGVTMGTTYTVRIADWPLPAPREDLNRAVFEVLDSIDRRMSTYQEDSELSRLNRNTSGEWVPVSKELFAVLDLALSVSVASGGAFDVTVGPLVNLWGFGPGNRPRRIPANEEIARALTRVGYTKLELDRERSAVRKALPDLYVDLSAVAKGYAVDAVIERLKAMGAGNAMVEVGGDVRAAGRSERGDAWRIGIERPAAGERAVERVIPLRDAGLATSGDYRNYFEENGVRYSHTIDPADGRPVRHRLAAVSVVDPSTARADAFATALLVLGPERGYALAESEGLAALFIIRTAGGFEERMTPAFARAIAD